MASTISKLKLMFSKHPVYTAGISTLLLAAVAVTLVLGLHTTTRMQRTTAVYVPSSEQLAQCKAAIKHWEALLSRYPPSKRNSISIQGPLKAAKRCGPSLPPIKPAGLGPPGTWATYTSGIIGEHGGEPVFSHEKFIGNNLWNGPVNGMWEVIYAGGVPTNLADPFSGPELPAVFVYKEGINPNAPGKPDTIGIIKLPGNTQGELTAISESGNNLVLRMSGGTPNTILFNVATLQFG